MYGLLAYVPSIVLYATRHEYLNKIASDSWVATCIRYADKHGLSGSQIVLDDPEPVTVAAQIALTSEISQDSDSHQPISNVKDFCRSA